MQNRGLCIRRICNCNIQYACVQFYGGVNHNIANLSRAMFHEKEASTIRMSGSKPRTEGISSTDPTAHIITLKGLGSGHDNLFGAPIVLSSAIRFFLQLRPYGICTLDSRSSKTKTVHEEYYERTHVTVVSGRESAMHGVADDD